MRIIVGWLLKESGTGTASGEEWERLMSAALNC